MVNLDSKYNEGGLGMAKKITNKKPLFGNKRSHALNATRKRWKPNFQKVKLVGGQSIMITARELKTLKKAEKK